jgi:hypothetical protein
MEVPCDRRHRGILCADSVISEQGSALAYAVTEWSETGKSNMTYAAPSSGWGSEVCCARVDMIQELRLKV